MTDLLDNIVNWLTTQGATAAAAVAVLIGGLLAAKLLADHLPVKRLHPQHQLITRRVVRYSATAIAIGWSLNILGIELGILLGAAGILTVAIGFAAQTSASNLISGLFIMAERPFRIDDVIRIEGITGTVVSVDLLSVRLRTFDHLLIRIPNETVLKSNVTNLTYFPIRRLDVKLGVAYKENVSRVRAVLFDLAHRNHLCLEEPEPLIIFKEFGDSSINLQFSVWSTRENFLNLQNSIHEEIKNAFDSEGIEIPFPHISIYAGSETAPIPVKIENNRVDTSPTATSEPPPL
ncbi:MAG: mechanosensitive ion channel family protein [Gemmatimonadota bacterium]|nr:mechanosensitive ion channel family protein [Gemmatimonadota bacterium]MDH5804457.1 mechanosensitive ion channel family protein [Gemmatimonadota bacterium]